MTVLKSANNVRQRNLICKTIFKIVYNLITSWAVLLADLISTDLISQPIINI